MKLRNFLYLNTKLLDDYLSTIDGYLSEMEVHTDSQTNKKAGQIKGGIPVIRGSGELESTESEEIKRKVKITDASKFEKLYNYLEMNKLEYYECIAEDNFRSFSRDDFIEVLASPRFSKLKELSDLAHKIGEFADTMKTYTGEILIDSKSEKAISGLDALGKLRNNNEIACVFSFDNNEYPLVAYLDEQYFKVSLDRFIGQVYVLCKVQRKLEKGKNIKLDEIFEDFKNMPLNREQRRKMPKNLNNPDEIKDIVKGPAFVVIPIAVYQ